MNFSKKMHDFMLKAVTGLAMFDLFLGVTFISLNIWLPKMMIVLAITWLFLFGLANGWFGDRKGKQNV